MQVDPALIRVDTGSACGFNYLESTFLSKTLVSKRLAPCTSAPLQPGVSLAPHHWEAPQHSPRRTGAPSFSPFLTFPFHSRNKTRWARCKLPAETGVPLRSTGGARVRPGVPSDGVVRLQPPENNRRGGGGGAASYRPWLESTPPRFPKI